MAIVPKKPQPAPQPRAEIPSPPPRRRIVPKPQESAIKDPAKTPQHCASPAPSAAPPKRKRGHAQKDERGKYMPTGDYPVGFGRAPVKNQFDGSRPGPGRPKGSRSQASIEREELQKKREITENGVRIKLSHRELATKITVKNALEKQNRHDLREVMEMARRHFPEIQTNDEAALPFGNAGLDQAILAQFFASLQLGEPATDVTDPFADAAFAPGGGTAPDAAWGEGDWAAPGYDEPDSDLGGSDADEEDGHDA